MGMLVHRRLSIARQNPVEPKEDTTAKEMAEKTMFNEEKPLVDKKPVLKKKATKKED